MSSSCRGGEDPPVPTAARLHNKVTIDCAAILWIIFIHADNGHVFTQLLCDISMGCYPLRRSTRASHGAPLWASCWSWCTEFDYWLIKMTKSVCLNILLLLSAGQVGAGSGAQGTVCHQRRHFLEKPTLTQLCVHVWCLQSDCHRL